MQLRALREGQTVFIFAVFFEDFVSPVLLVLSSREGRMKLTKGTVFQECVERGAFLLIIA